MSNVGVMPAEVVETNYRVRILRNEFVSGSQGLGEFNGGMGIRREDQILDHDQRATFYGEQTNGDFAPCGAAGGGHAHSTTVTVISPDGARRVVNDKTSTTLAAGTVVLVETAGGGGFGPVERRDPVLAARDRREGRLA